VSDERADTATGFAVDLPVFSGPFRILADLLLDQKIDVCDVPVGTITDAYLRYARGADGWTLDEATWFLAVCAVLLELKVGRLMPRHDVVDEEDLLGVSPDLAYARSLELAAFRQVSDEIAGRIETEALHHARDAGPAPEFAHLYPDVLAGVTGEDLARVAASLLRPPPALDLYHVTPIRYSMEDALAAVTSHLGRAGRARFRDLVADCEARIHVVVRFLALLELYREGKVDLSQAETFGEIQVEWQGEVQG
jgi:segregation and condensation protein A